MSDNEISVKTKIDTNLLNWYFEDSKSFYLLLNQNGEIENFSENSMIFFALEEIYSIEDKHISNFIGKNNWDFISSKIKNNSKESDFIDLPEPVNRNELSIKWKYTGDYYFILFKKLTIEKESEIEEVRSVEEDQAKDAINHYQNILNNLAIPSALIKNNDFILKNSRFELLMKNAGASNYSSFKEWIEKNQFTDEVDEYKKITLDNIDYKLLTANIESSEHGEIILINLVKDTSKIKEIHEDNQDIDNEDRDTSKESIFELKVNIDKILNEISESFNYDFNIIKTGMNSDIKSYKEITVNIKENLLKIADDFNFIDDISVRIHLISINAAIESAKKGELGKGFAVISREIAKLSTEIKNYTKQIENRIKSIESQTRVIQIEEYDENGNIYKNLQIIENNHEKLKESFYKIKNLTDNFYLSTDNESDITPETAIYTEKP